MVSISKQLPIFWPSPKVFRVHLYTTYYSGSIDVGLLSVPTTTFSNGKIIGFVSIIQVIIINNNSLIG